MASSDTGHCIKRMAGITFIKNPNTNTVARISEKSTDPGMVDLQGLKSKAVKK